MVFTLLSSVALAGGQATEPRDGFPIEYHDAAYRFVVGKILKVQYADAEEYERFTLMVLADQREQIKSGTSISIRGPSHPRGGASSGTYSIHAAVGQTAVFFVKTTDKPGQFDNHHIVSVFPFGMTAEDPCIPPEDVPRLAVAFEELNADLVGAGGIGMPHERAEILLCDKNIYLWSLACWRLVREAEREDILKLEAQFHEALTPAQALYLDLLFDDVTGDATGSVPGPEIRRGLLRSVLESYAKAKVAPQTAPAEK